MKEICAEFQIIGLWLWLQSSRDWSLYKKKIGTCIIGQYYYVAQDISPVLHCVRNMKIDFNTGGTWRRVGQ